MVKTLLLNYKVIQKIDSEAMFSLAPNPLYQSFMESLISYLEVEQENNETLFNLKIKEKIFQNLYINGMVCLLYICQSNLIRYLKLWG